MQHLYRKYANRKIYAVGTCKYVTLQDLATEVLSGINPTIVCAETRRDITAEVLAQVVAVKRKRFPLSVPELLSEIRSIAAA